MDELNENLIKLHQADFRIGFLETFLEEAPAKAQENAERRQAAEDDLAQKADKLDHSKRELKRKEAALADEEGRMEKTQAKLNQAKTNKEYDAALKEIEDHNAKIGKLEEEILLLFDEVEEAEKGKAELDSRRKEMLAEFDRDDAELKGLVARAEGELEKAKAEREKIAALVHEEHLKVYDRVAGAKGRPVARVDKEICLGCHHRLPAQLYNMVLKGDQLLTCNFCNRILVYTETELEEGLSEL